MDRSIRVRHVQGDQFELSVRDHQVLVDQPVEDGGADAAPTPTELFVGSLASCVAFYAGRYLSRHDLPTAGLVVDARYEIASRPTRVGEITIEIQVPDGVPEEKLAGLLAVASHCTVHNTLAAPPPVTISLDRSLTQAA